ncbi:Na+/H+ antiporter subunit A [Schinkia azotoformans]|uniref:Na+/H+ antiporter subunit A n=1 Tax=Schinkia azotoformans TaxID=1454 RepID=UPI002E1AAE33|nr:Na+/H+ antiporter subunit A [Schinkia azotoformans]MED4350815.1 Na+/H+ antiporter subunit A [Schinkia azotoformans]
MQLLHLMIFLPFLFVVFIPFLYKRFNSQLHTGWFVLFIPLILLLYLVTFIPKVSNGNTIFASMPWIPSYHIDFTIHMDGLSLLFGLLVAGIGTLVVLYSIYYLSKHREALHNFYVYLLLFMGAMMGLVFSDNIFVLYVFWEMTSISSFLLIAYWYERDKSRYGAQKSMLITIFGGLAMLAGLIMLSMIADTCSIREMVSSNRVTSFYSHDLFIPAMILILLGAFTKSAQFPFSIWLPDAMEAPTPISAYLHSATMVKAGIYLVARLTPIFGGSDEWFWLVTGVGLVTLLYGSINAVRQTDLKALLAYSTISQLGLIMSLLGLGSAALYYGLGDEATVYAIAVFAAIFHLVNHSTFKGCLFMVVGIIDHETGTRDIRRLGGLMHFMPISFTLTIVGGFAMAGLPPFNGFLSKEMFFAAVINVVKMDFVHNNFIGTLIPVLAWIASAFTFVYCMILIFKTFKGKNKVSKVEKPIHEAPMGMLIPPLILGLLVILIFMFPNVLSAYLLQPAWSGVLPELAEKGKLQIEISAWHGLNTELWMTIGVIVVGTILYLTLRKWYRVYLIYPEAATLNRLYDNALKIMELFSRRITDRYMTGYIRDYLVYIFVFIVVMVGGSLWLFDGFVYTPSMDAPVNIYEVSLVIAMVISALTVLLSKSRMTAVISVGALGFFVSFFFVLFRAPDLALTQLVVETVTTVLFLLCFYHLPQFKKEMSHLRFKVSNAFISIVVGIVVTIVALSANGTRLFPSISSYYEDAYVLAGAKNVVNAILVDFRGIDTMLEILVLTIAGLGVYILIKLRLSGRGRDKNEEAK